MKAPFPWFGGKRRVASDVWAALGDVQHYVEPFAGSLAVLLERPPWHTGNTETVNDADQYIANFWRALAHDPDGVAHHADWPVNETDLFSRHLWLVNEGKRQMIVGMEADPEWYDAKIAGWWVWGISQWIGSGWCSGKGPHTYADGGAGDSRQLPHLSRPGQGVNRKRPHIATAGKGINRQLPHLIDSGKGIHRERENLYGYMQELANRLRNVRVCCGDWERIVTAGALSHGTTVGIFLDPPYSDKARRDNDLYAVDSLDVAHDVRAWCIANGDNPRYRIALAGYEDEHGDLMPSTWRKLAYSASRAYGSSTGEDTANVANRHKERLWFSPHCLNPQPMLLEVP